jgi:hypothetical protein
MINKLRNIFDSKVIRTFRKRKIEVTLREDEVEDALIFVEDSEKSLLTKLSIIHSGDKSELIHQQLPDTVIVEADFDTGDHSKYSTFVKKRAFFLTKQVDFFILHQKGERLYVAVCDMKSSRKGDNLRCAQQIEHARFFLTYILDSAIASEKYKPEATNNIKEYYFIKLLFIPSDDLSMAMSLTVNPEDDNSNLPFEMNGETNFYLLNMDIKGTHARENWSNIANRFPH